MSRNGTDFGIRVSGTGDAWFTAPVEMPVGLYFAGFSAADALITKGTVLAKVRKVLREMDVGECMAAP